MILIIIFRAPLSFVLIVPEETEGEEQVEKGEEMERTSRSLIEQPDPPELPYHTIKILLINWIKLISLIGITSFDFDSSEIGVL